MVPTAQDTASESDQIQVPGLDKPPKGCFLNFRWGVGDEIVLFNSPRPVPAGEEPALIGAGQETRNEVEEEPSTAIKSISWDNVPDEFSSLARVGASSFSRVQASLNLQSNLEKRKELLAASRELRSELAQCTLRLEERVMAMQDQHMERSSSIPSEEEIDQIDKLRLANATWHLCEIMALEEDGPMLAHLLEWVAEHFPRCHPAEEQERITDISQNKSDSTSYWAVIYDLVFGGHMEGAWSLLRLHTQYQIACDDGNESLVTVFEAVRDLLLSMPKLKAGASASEIKEFNSEWIQWHQSVEQTRAKHPLLSDSESDREPGLYCLVKILSGDLEVLFECLTGSLDTWKHLMVVTLLFTQPGTTKNGMGALARHCIQLKLGASDDTSSWPAQLHLLPAVLDGEFTLALQLLHSCVGDRWVDAHLADLLGHARVIETTSLGFDAGPHPEEFLVAGMQTDLREYFVLQYALQLGLGGRHQVHGTNSTKSWTIPSVYFNSLDRMINVPSGHVEQLGRDPMELVLTRAHHTDDRVVQRITALAEGLGLDETANQLRRVRAMYWWCAADGGRDKSKSGSFQGVANALLWAARAGQQHVRVLVNRILEVGNSAALDTLVDHLGASLQLANGSHEFDKDMVTLLRSYHALRANLQQASELLDDTNNDQVVIGDDIANLRYKALVSLCELLKANVVPKHFWASLIHQVLLWQSHRDEVRRVPIQMTMEQGLFLLTCLQQLEVSHEKDKLVGSESGLAPQDKTMMYYVLNQGMAHAVMYVGQPDAGNVSVIDA